MSRGQLLAFGLTPRAVDHRIAIGRLHRVSRGIYAVGRPQLTQHGRWMAAVLACGPEAVLSHQSAAALWEIRRCGQGRIEVSVPALVARRPPGVLVHRRSALGAVEVTRHLGIPVTNPPVTLVDLAARLPSNQLEAAINQALRDVLDRRSFTLTDSDLERRFLPIARAAGLPLPQTGIYLNGFRVDFFWPKLGLVVETDGLRYHRTPAEQARDRLRDQAHTAAGLTPLRFTRAQVRFEPGHVRATLVAVAGRLATGR